MEIAIQQVHEDGWDVVSYVGPINEEAEVHLAPLVDQLGKKCIFNLSQVNYVNSCGVRGWINFVRAIEKEREIIFEQCTPEIVMQINMIPSFKSSAKVKSVFASYTCENCGHQQQVLFEEGVNLPENEDGEIPVVPCPRCNHDEMEMEELEEEFFAFLGSA